MALIVTPGDADADAMISRAYFQDYCAARGYDLADFDEDTEIDPAIRRGSTGLGSGCAWKGQKLNGRSQAQAWPRSGVTDAEGLTVDPETIPPEIEQATAESSWYELTVGPLAPSVAMAGQIKREKTDVLETEYFGATTADASRPVLLLVQDIVAGLVSVTTSSLAGSAVRV